jgi:hypothetical protein
VYTAVYIAVLCSEYLLVLVEPVTYKQQLQCE